MEGSLCEKKRKGMVFDPQEALIGLLPKCIT